MTYQFNFDPVFRDFDKMLWGLGLGLYLAAIGLLIGCVIGLLVAYGRQSRITPCAGRSGSMSRRSATAPSCC